MIVYGARILFHLFLHFDPPDKNAEQFRCQLRHFDMLFVFPHEFPDINLPHVHFGYFIGHRGKFLLQLLLVLFITRRHNVIPLWRYPLAHPLLIETAYNVIQILNPVFYLRRFLFRSGVKHLCFRLTFSGRLCAKFIWILSGKCSHLTNAFENNLIDDRFADIMRGTVSRTFQISTAHEVVFCRVYGCSSMKIQPFSAFATEEMAHKFICLAMLVRSFSSLEMHLHHVKGFPVDNSFMCVLKNKYVFFVVFEPLFKLEDKYIIGKFTALTKEVTDNLDRFELGLAVQKLYDFIWDIYCDWYIEISKIRLNGDNAAAAETARAVLVYIMTGMLKLLHPFMPFITEEIFLVLPHSGDSIMISAWPEYSEELIFPAAVADFDKVIALIRAIRNRRAEMNVPPSKRVSAAIETNNTAAYLPSAAIIAKLAGLSEVAVSEKAAAPADVVTVVTADAKAYIPLDDLIDRAKERERLEKELAAAESDHAFIMQKLGNAEFMSKAPQKVIDGQQQKLDEVNDKLGKIKEALAAL